MFPKVEFMLDMYDDIDWMDEPTETGWMPAPEQVKQDLVRVSNPLALVHKRVSSKCLVKIDPSAALSFSLDKI